MPLRLRHPRPSADPSEGPHGLVRVDPRTKDLTKRLKHGEIAIIDQRDIDKVSAEALVAAQPSAVVNASESISGRYPNLGPDILVNSGIILIDGVGEKIFGRLKDGAKIRLDGATVYSGEEAIAEGVEQTQESVADLMIERFLTPDPPPLDSNVAAVAMRLPALCALASAPAPCFARLRALRPRLAAITGDMDDFTLGAER